MISNIYFVFLETLAPIIDSENTIAVKTSGTGSFWVHERSVPSVQLKDQRKGDTQSPQGSEIAEGHPALLFSARSHRDSRNSEP